MSTAAPLRGNAILRPLPDAEFRRLEAHAEVLEAGTGQRVYQPGAANSRR